MKPSMRILGAHIDNSYLQRHPEKPLDIPSQIATVLGFIINALDMTISFTTQM